MYYGFDMGGTKIELGVFDDRLQRIWQKRVPTPREDYRQLLATLCEMAFASRCGLEIDLGAVPGSALEKIFTEELGVVVQADPFQVGARPAVRRGVAETLEPAEVGHHVQHRLLAVQAALLRQVAEPRPEGGG